MKIVINGTPSSENSTPKAKNSGVITLSEVPKMPDLGSSITSMLSKAYSSAPTYHSRYERSLSDLYDKMVSRPDFSYDAASDPLYRQYKEHYISHGKSAMEDTMGKAASLTGGYGNTYGEVAGKQQYDLWLDKLPDTAADLYDRAYSKYKAEGDSLSDQYKLLLNREKEDYDRYRDSVADYQKKITLLQNAAEKEYERELENYWKSLDFALTLKKQKG